MQFDFTKREAKILKASKSLVDYLLSLNTNNRTPRKGHTAWIKKAIEDGNFVLTGQGVSISTQGKLIDGQHRLLAIKEAGYPSVDLLVVTGLDEKSRIYVDQHAKRSTADMLKIVLNKNVSGKMASISQMSFSIAETKDGFVWAREKVQLEEIMEHVAKNSYWLSLIVSAGGQKMRAGMATALFHYAEKMQNIDPAIELAESAKNGEGLYKHDPAYKLRSLMLGLVGNKARYGGSGQLLDYKNTVTCCIAHALGNKIELLKPVNSWDKLPKVQKRTFLKAV